MMLEVKIYLNPNKEKEITDKIVFEKILAGEITKKSIYVLNVINREVNIDLTLEGQFVKITKTIEKLSPNQMKEVVFEFTPKITIMQPIEARLKIKLDYVIG